jgi:hypothetical protein
MTRIAPPTADKPATTGGALERRALRLWPRLDGRELSQCAGDPERVIHLVARHANLTIDAVTGILAPPDRTEPPFYFG